MFVPRKDAPQRSPKRVSTRRQTIKAALATFRVALLEPEAGPEVVFTAASARDAVTWVKEWLREPIDLAVAIYPPGVPVPGLATSAGKAGAR